MSYRSVLVSDQPFLVDIANRATNLTNQRPTATAHVTE